MHAFLERLPGGDVCVVAHRGGRHHWPENTMRAFRGALDSGAHVLELDVRLSADGIPVVMHDETVDRTTDGTGRVQGFTLEELRRLDAGYSWSPPGVPDRKPYRGTGLTVPTLEEVLEAFPGALLLLELKKGPVELTGAVGELIRRHGRADTTMVASFQTSLLRAFRACHPEIATSAGRSEVLGFWLARRLSLHRSIKPGYVALQVPERFHGLRVVTPAFVESARRMNLAVHVWTVNATEDMTRLLDMGVEALITDAVDRALELSVTRRRRAAFP